MEVGTFLISKPQVGRPAPLIVVNPLRLPFQTAQGACTAWDANTVILQLEYDLLIRQGCYRSRTKEKLLLDNSIDHQRKLNFKTTPLLTPL
jgi:hypothetical protein